VFGNLWNLKYSSYPIAQNWKKHKRNIVFIRHNIFFFGGEGRQRMGQGLEPLHVTAKLTVVGILLQEN